MAYISVDVDIDLNKIDTDDLVGEVCRRMKNSISRKGLTDKEKAIVKETFSELEESLSLTPTEYIEVKTLDDKIKYEHLVKVFSKYTPSEIENKLP